MRIGKKEEKYSEKSHCLYNNDKIFDCNLKSLMLIFSQRRRTEVYFF